MILTIRCLWLETGQTLVTNLYLYRRNVHTFHTHVCERYEAILFLLFQIYCTFQVFLAENANTCILNFHNFDLYQWVKSESWGQRWQEVILKPFIFHASWNNNKNVNARYTKLHLIYMITKNTFTELFCRIFKSLYYIPNIWRCNYLNEERIMTTNISDQSKQSFVSSGFLQSSLTKLEILINMWPS